MRGAREGFFLITLAIATVGGMFSIIGLSYGLDLATWESYQPYIGEDGRMPPEVYNRYLFQAGESYTLGIGVGLAITMFLLMAVVGLYLGAILKEVVSSVS